MMWRGKMTADEWIAAHKYTGEKLRHIKDLVDYADSMHFGLISRILLHRYNNIRFEETGKGALAISAGQLSITNTKDSRKQFDKERKTIVASLILLLLLLFLAFYFGLLFMGGRIKPYAGAFQLLSAVSSTYKSWVTGAVDAVRLLKALRCSLWRFFLPVLWLVFFLAPLRALLCRALRWLCACAHIPRGPCDTINVLLNTGPLFFGACNPAWTALFLPATLNPFLIYEWPLTRWWLYVIRVVYVTIAKPIITIVERQYMLGIETSMGINQGGPGFWTGFPNLIPPMITLYTCNISYVLTTYAYTIIT